MSHVIDIKQSRHTYEPVTSHIRIGHVAHHEQTMSHIWISDSRWLQIPRQFVHVYIYIYISICTCVYIHIYINLSSICTCVYIHTCVNMYVCIYTYTYKNVIWQTNDTKDIVNIYVCTYTYIYQYVHVYIYMYIYKYAFVHLNMCVRVM